MKPYTLIINRSDSKCGHCGKGALPRERRHDTVPGYHPGEGCHVRWLFVTSDYGGGGIEEAAMRLRPDLEPDFPFADVWSGRVSETGPA